MSGVKLYQRCWGQFVIMSTPPTLQNLLLKFRTSLFKVPHDNIYGFSGLASDWAKSDIQVDYSKPLLQYTERFCLSTVLSLVIATRVYCLTLSFSSLAGFYGTNLQPADLTWPLYGNSLLAISAFCKSQMTKLSSKLPQLCEVHL